MGGFNQIVLLIYSYKKHNSARDDPQKWYFARKIMFTKSSKHFGNLPYRRIDLLLLLVMVMVIAKASRFAP